MAHVNYLDKDDMQDETYNTLSELLISAIRAFREKHIKNLHSDLDAMFCVIWTRMKEPDRTKVEKELTEIGNRIFSTEDLEEEELTQLFDRTRELFKLLTKALDDIGILFKIKANLDALVTQGSE